MYIACEYSRFLFYWLRNRNSTLREAPEADSVLSAQLEMPFQVLIPAYLPTTFIREKIQVSADKIGPHGEPMIKLVYPTRRGDTLTFYEWLPSDQGVERGKPYCMCFASRVQIATSRNWG